MEIVPILSTIILVGTVATFILAVAAYVLYKIREGGFNSQGAPQEARPEPHVLLSSQHRNVITAENGDASPVEATTYFAPGGAEPPNPYVNYSGSNGDGDMITPGMFAEHPMPQRMPGPNGEIVPLSAFFWEYTGDGFAPVEPVRPGSTSNPAGENSASEE